MRLEVNKNQKVLLQTYHIAVYRFHSFTCAHSSHFPVVHCLLHSPSSLAFVFLSFFFLLLLHTVFNLFTDQNNLHALSICPSRFTIKKKERWLKVSLLRPCFLSPNWSTASQICVSDSLFSCCRDCEELTTQYENWSERQGDEWPAPPPDVAL